MTVRRFAPPLLALALLVGTAPAAAQTPLDDPLDARDARRVDRMERVVRELRAIVFQMRDTGKPVVVQPADTEYRLEEMTTRIGDLEQTLRRLNGTLETTAFELSQTRRDNERLRAQVETLTERLGAAEQRLTEPAASSAAAAPATAPTGDPAQAFTQARQLMLAGDYAAAESAFADFVEAYPDGSRAAEARYWLGKTLTVRGAHSDAATAYIGAIRGWPQTSWAPDAVVELSRSLIALKRTKDACQTLAEFSKRYPKPPTSVANRAAAARTQAKCAA